MAGAQDRPQVQVPGQFEVFYREQWGQIKWRFPDVLCDSLDCVQRWGCLVSGMGVSDRDELIYNAHRGELVRYASALVGPDSGPDLVSVVITRVLAKRRLSDLGDPRMYLFRAIGNEAKTHKRNYAHRQVVQLVTPDTVPAFELDTALDAVMNLPVQQRAATYLVYWLQFTPSEAAVAMGCRPGTVRRYLHLARRRLEEVLDAPE